MTILDLTIKLMRMQHEHGNVRVMIDSFSITNIEYVHAIEGEHESYIDLCSQDQ